MLSNISWTDFFIFLGGTLMVYYGYLALVYYRAELVGLLRRTAKSGQSPSEVSPSQNTAQKKRVWHVEEVNSDEQQPGDDHGPYIPPPAPEPAGGYPLRQPSTNDEEQTLPSALFLEQQEEEGQMLEPDFAMVPEMQQLQAVVDQLREMFTLNNQLSKQQLFSQIRNIISAFAGLRQQPYRVAINNLIISEAKDKCSLVLEEKEVESLWK